MASRRMFSIKIIDSAKFIKMPSSTQALYFHLIARADDDGVVEAFNVMRVVGATEDDLKILVAKGFVSVLNDDLVSFILDWTEHNKIRADRKIDSIYKNLLLNIHPTIQLLEPKERADRQNAVHGTSHGQPNDGIGKDRLGKDRLGKDINKDKKFKPPTLEEVEEYIIEKGYVVNPEYFFEYYQVGDWKNSKNKKIVSWKRTVATWNQKELKDNPNARPYKKKTIITVNEEKPWMQSFVPDGEW